jgi:transcriptional regulator with XRE-family HTH domain
MPRPASPSPKRPTFEEVVGRVLRSIRTDRGLSQERLGNESGSGRTYASQLERGERGPTLKALFRFARTLGVPPSDIVREIERGIADRHIGL